MHLFDAWTRDALGRALSTEGDGSSRLFRDATVSTLREVAWGLVVKDMKRLFGLSSNGVRDRGWALEAAWVRRLIRNSIDDGSSELSRSFENRVSGALRFESVETTFRRSMVGKTADGSIPAMLIGSTRAGGSSRSWPGERFVFAPVRGPSLDGPGGRRNFGTYLRDRDLPVVTAVRMSATFPYVSPIAAARMLDPDEEVGDPLALGDGGYFDNLGFGTAVDWLRDVEHSVPGARYCFVHVRPPADELGPTDVGNKASGNQDAERWRREVLGPIELLLEARDTTQAQRAEIGEDLLRRWLGERYESVTLAPLGTLNAPLSWHLSRKETEALRKTWDPDSAGEARRGERSANDEALEKLVEFLGR